MHEVTPLTNIICLFFKLFSNRGFKILDFRRDATISKISFGDPQPDPPDFHVFGPPGSIFRLNPDPDPAPDLYYKCVYPGIRGTDPGIRIRTKLSLIPTVPKIVKRYRYRINW